MKTSSVFFIMVFIGTVFICGCTQTVSENQQGPETTVLPSTQMTAVTTVPLPPATIPVPPKDPIIGSWMSYKYLATGKIELFWTFSENNTYTLVNTNVKSQHKKFVQGTWSKAGADTYQVSTSGTPLIFTYDRTNDACSDTFFLVNYSRVTGTEIRQERVPTMNITLFYAQSVPEIVGSHPYRGNKYLIVNISIKNVNETGWYIFTDDTIWAIPDDGTGSSSLNQKLSGILENPFPPGKIPLGETRQGNVIFGVPEKSQSFTLKLVDRGGNTISNIIRLDTIQTSATYSADAK